MLLHTPADGLTNNLRFVRTRMISSKIEEAAWPSG